MLANVLSLNLSNIGFFESDYFFTEWLNIPIEGEKEKVYCFELGVITVAGVLNALVVIDTF